MIHLSRSWIATYIDILSKLGEVSVGTPNYKRVHCSIKEIDKFYKSLNKNVLFNVINLFV